MEKFTSVIDYIQHHKKYVNILNKLRDLLLKTELKETVKWGMPTYTYDNKNLVGIGAFKNHVGLWFFQGALINDEFGVLANAQEGKTKAMRQIHLSSIEEINEKMVLDYVAQTINNQKLGRIIKPKKNTSKLILPDELNAAFENNIELKNSFNKLSTGKQREYAEHISSAKRETTKMSRLEKIIPLILDEKGLYDQYKNC